MTDPAAHPEFQARFTFDGDRTRVHITDPRTALADPSTAGLLHKAVTQHTADPIEPFEFILDSSRAGELAASRSP